MYCNPTYGIYENEQGVLFNTYYIGDNIPDLECLLIAEKKGCLLMQWMKSRQCQTLFRLKKVETARCVNLLNVCMAGSIKYSLNFFTFLEFKFIIKI